MVQQAVADGRLSAGHARTLLAIADPRQQEWLAAQVESEGLSVREVEQLVQRRLTAPPQAHLPGRVVSAGGQRLPDTIPPTPDDDALVRGFESALGLPVELQRRRRGGGRVVVTFAAAEDLDRRYR